MIIIETNARPRFYLLLTYATMCRTLKCSTKEVDIHVKKYASRNEITPIIAFEELLDICLDIEASKHMREMADECIGY